MLAIVYVIALLVVPLTLHLRGGGPVLLFASVAVVQLTFAGLVSLWHFIAPGSFVWAFAPEQVLLSGADAIRERHAVSNGAARSLRTLAGTWAAIALVVWGMASWRALYFPKALMVCFWCLNTAVLCAYVATIASTYLVLRRGAAQPAVLEWVFNIKFAAGVVLMLSIAGLLALFADALFRRLRRGPAEG